MSDVQSKKRSCSDRTQVPNKKAKIAGTGEGTYQQATVQIAATNDSDSTDMEDIQLSSSDNTSAPSTVRVTRTDTQTDAQAQNEAWACSTCTYLNHPLLPSCEICGANKRLDDDNVANVSSCTPSDVHVQLLDPPPFATSIRTNRHGPLGDKEACEVVNSLKGDTRISGAASNTTGAPNEHKSLLSEAQDIISSVDTKHVGNTSVAVAVAGAQVPEQNSYVGRSGYTGERKQSYEEAVAAEHQRHADRLAQLAREYNVCGIKGCSRQMQTSNYTCPGCSTRICSMCRSECGVCHEQVCPVCVKQGIDRTHTPCSNRQCTSLTCQQEICSAEDCCQQGCSDCMEHCSSCDVFYCCVEHMEPPPCEGESCDGDIYEYARCSCRAGVEMHHTRCHGWLCDSCEHMHQSYCKAHKYF